jgi:RNA polymerase sigma factor (sigma-70 family)
VTEAEAVKQYTPFVAKTAQQFSGVPKEDLIQEGLVAVALAYRQWRPDGGATFLNWIRKPVYYAMLKVVEEQRRGGGSFRSTRQGAGDRKIVLVSMDESIGEEESLHDELGAFDEPRDVFAMGRLPDAVSQLETTERQVIRLLYEKGLTHAEVGKKLKMKKILVMEIEAKALARLRELVPGDLGES